MAIECADIAKAAQLQIDNLMDLHEMGYTENPLDGTDIINAIRVAKAIKAGELKKARAMAEVIHEVGLINTGVIRYGKMVGKSVLKHTEKNGVHEFTVDFGKFVKKVPYITVDDMSIEQFEQKHAGWYNSAADMKVNMRNLDRDYKKLEKDMWKDPEAMLTLFDRLVSQETGVTEHTKKLRSVLEHIVDPQRQILNEFKIYMNESAKKNGGVAVVYGNGADAKIILDIKEGGTYNPNELSAAEVYVHEMVHMAVETASTYRRGALSGIMNEYRNIHKYARENITKEQIGEELWNYLFLSDNALSEFMAYAMTNEKLQKILGNMKLPTDIDRDKTYNTWFDYLLVKFVELYDALRAMILEQRKEKTVEDRISYLAMKIMEHNNITREKSKIEEGLEKISQAREWANVQIVKGVKAGAKHAGKALDAMIENNEDNAFGTLLRGVDGVAAAINPWPTDKQKMVWEETRKNLNAGAQAAGLGETFAPEGQISKLWDHMRNDDKVKRGVEQFILQNQQIDRKREEIVGTVAGKIGSDLKGLGKSERASITRTVLETDLNALVGLYTIEDMAKMMESDAEIDKAIEKEYKLLDQRIRSDKARNFFKSQTKGLGYYLATGISGKAVYKSANRILYSGAEMFALDNLSDRQKEREVEAIIDRLATIEAIRYSKKEDRTVAAKAMRTHEAGIVNIMTLHKLTMDQNKILAQKYKTYVYPDKGEIKEIKPSYMNTRVNYKDEETVAKMKKLGFKLKGDTGVRGIALYVRQISDLGAFDKQALAKINISKRLHSIDTMHNLTETGDVTAEVEERLEKIKKDTHKELLEMSDGVKLPVMDGLSMQVVQGEIVNYSVSIPKDMQEVHIKQEKKVDVVLAKMVAELQEKEMAHVLNAEVWDSMIRDQVRNYRRGTMTGKKEYIEIGPDSIHENSTARKYAQKIWDGMPQDVRKKILKRGDKNRYIAVRRDLADMYFGRRAPSFLRAELPLVDWTIEDKLRQMNAGFVADWLMLAGELWQEMVSLQKIDIVIRTPMVVINNIWSNANLAMALGQAPWETIRNSINMMRATKQYLDLEKKKRQLVLDRRLATTEAKREELKKEIRMIDIELRDNEVHPLMKAGMFTTIMEDLSKADLTQKSRIEEKAEKVGEYIPQWMKDTGSALWITQDSKLFNAMSMVVQYSDFVARANRYHYLIAKGTPKDKALQFVLDEHVNYGLDLGSVLTWLDKMGFARFIKYFVGSNKMMIDKATQDPLALVTLAVTGVESPVGSFALTKDWEYTIMSPITTAFSMTEQHILEPTMLQYAGILD